ncbi:hypothetical protein B0H17DRAFT_167045 [Mycena rosella]|uniref:Uncharacterized protein n=1 Tax=Mycena rosella TaxID=1033263 RepID=A0AAD7DX31_MYCRO|nr:hypothetical protein B0H17DRAFT_167045 [Mycena rosella]
MNLEIFSQSLSLISVVLMPFIPNAIMRYISMIVASVCFAVHLAFHNSPTCLVTRLAASMEELLELFSTAVIECTRALQFIYRTELELTELKYAVSNLRTRAINAKKVSWKVYPYHVGCLVVSIIECQHDIIDLRASIMLAIESARQQTLQEEINRKKTTLAVNFPGGRDQARTLRMRLSSMDQFASEDQVHLRLVQMIR